MITTRKPLQAGIQEGAEGHQIVHPKQRTTRRDTLEVVNDPQRCPTNRYGDKLSVVRHVADQRHPRRGQPVVDLDLTATERMEGMRDANAPNSVQRLRTVRIPTRCTSGTSTV